MKHRLRGFESCRDCSALTSRGTRLAARISLFSGLLELAEVLDGKFTTSTNPEGCGASLKLPVEGA